MPVHSDAPELSPALLDALREALARGPELRLAVAFGSVAAGTARSDSDLDIAILPSDPALPLRVELELATELSNAAGREVDIVRLDRDDPLLHREVAKRSVAIYEASAGVFAAYRAEAMSRWIDFDETIAPFRARYLARLARPRA